MQADVLIIGGGLSGLRLASLLAEAGRTFHLIEARNRLGGRILSEKSGNARFDLGPAWFWPGQPRMAELVQRLGLTQFDQYATGALTYEDETGAVQRGRGFSSMEGSFRLEGGIAALIDALASRLPQDRIHLGHQATEIEQQDDGVDIHCQNGAQFSANHVVLALPPRVATTLPLTPALPTDAQAAMQSIPTWMAGQAKAVAVYDHPFWRQNGLSGDAMSRRGPMVEIHDASPAQASPYALFGFIGVPPHHRRDEAALRNALLDQLERLFGPEARSPRDLFVKDWASDPFTATELDLQPLYAHPTYGRPPALRTLGQGRILQSGTELATQFGGYLEGALEAAEDAFAQLTSSPR